MNMFHLNTVWDKYFHERVCDDKHVAVEGSFLQVGCFKRAHLLFSDSFGECVFGERRGGEGGGAGLLQAGPQLDKLLITTVTRLFALQFRGFDLR